MAAPRMGDILKAFTGEGNVVAWLKKVKLVAKLQKITDLASLLPLYLEGDALALYLELSDKEQGDAKEIERKLLEAFTDSEFVAFGKLTQKRWSGEPVDVYANDLRRLAGLAGITGDNLERIVLLSFVNGFPDNVSCELQQIRGIFEEDMSDVISRARVLTTNKSELVVAAAARPYNEYSSRNEGGGPQEGNRVFKGQCYICGGPHMARWCDKNRERKEIICYRCNKPGHIASQCYQGNDRRVAGAPAATQ